MRLGGELLIGVVLGLSTMVACSPAPESIVPESRMACEEKPERTVEYWTRSPPNTADEVDREIDNLLADRLCVTITPATFRRLLHDINRSRRP